MDGVSWLILRCCQSTLGWGITYRVISAQGNDRRVPGGRAVVDHGQVRPDQGLVGVSVSIRDDEDDVLGLGRAPRAGSDSLRKQATGEDRGQKHLREWTYGKRLWMWLKE